MFYQFDKLSKNGICKTEPVDPDHESDCWCSVQYEGNIETDFHWILNTEFHWLIVD